jgi:acetyltransferase-like isoleucine patch superfamily enzyme
LFTAVQHFSEYFMSKLFSVVWRESAAFRRWKYKTGFRGLDVHSNAHLNIEGEFVYGKGCTICSGARIIVEKGSRLVLGDGVIIMNDALVQPLAGCSIEIGDDTSIQDRCSILGNVRVGRHTLFAPNAYVSSGQHYFDAQPHLLIRDQDMLTVSDREVRTEFMSSRVDIEDDCWLGINSVLMKNIRIAKGCVIGANSVVTKSPSPYTVIAGIPAKFARKRLNFAPPPRISWEKEEDLPYFYSGFFVKAAERKAWSRNQAIAARREFSLALALPSAPDGGIADTNAPQTLCLTAQALHPNARLAHGASVHQLSTTASEYTFAATPDELGRLNCVVEVDGVRNSDAAVLVQRASIE